MTFTPEQYQTIIESLVLKIDKLSLEVELIKSKVRNQGCQCQSEEEHYSSGCSQ
tara:strand:- start:407 stop:568 length:162 start_codon:yes stop_codon:yes gene_type:complete